ncbi:unnamed protein product, partial [Durusdinium trenchii]
VTDKCLSKLFFMGKFRLAEQTFEQGTHGHSKSKPMCKAARAVLSSAKDLSKDEKKLEEAAFSTASFGLFKRSRTKAIADGSGSASDGPLALLDKQEELSDKVWGQAQSQLHLALGGFVKMEKICFKALQDIGVDNKEDPVYT